MASTSRAPRSCPQSAAPTPDPGTPLHPTLCHHRHQVLRDWLGTDAVNVTIGSEGNRAAAPRTFTSLEAINTEAGVSRVFGGIVSCCRCYRLLAHAFERDQTPPIASAPPGQPVARGVFLQLPTRPVCCSVLKAWVWSASVHVAVCTCRSVHVSLCVSVRAWC
jgi:hypothetical protein